MYLNGIAQRKVWGELQVAQAHASDWAGAVASGQPPLYAQPIVGVARRDHDRVGHQLHADGAVEGCGCTTSLWPRQPSAMH